MQVQFRKQVPRVNLDFYQVILSVLFVYRKSGESLNKKGHFTVSPQVFTQSQNYEVNTPSML